MREAEVLGAPAVHDEKALSARARHDAVEEPEGLRDEPGSKVLVHRERALHEREGEPERVLALGDAQLAEVLPGRSEVPHVVVGEECEARVRAARTVGIHRVARELAEVRYVVAEGVDVVGVARDARDNVRIPGLHGARRPAQRHHPARPAEADRVEPAGRHPEVLHEADRIVRGEREARDAHPVDVVLREARARKQLRERAPEEPVGAADGIALVRNGHRGGDHHVVVRLSNRGPHDGDRIVIASASPVRIADTKGRRRQT